MLDSLRDFAKTVPGKVMGAFLLVGVAGFGINNVILNFGNNTIARVGDQEITTREFQRAYNAQINQITSQTGRMPTREEAENMGLPIAIIQRLSQNAALDGLAEQFGLGVSDDKLAQMLRQDPSFAGTLGGFDADRFGQVLQASGLTEAEYFERQSDSARREQLALALFTDVPVPDTAVDLLGRYLGDTRTVDYVVVDEQSVLPPEEPTEEDLQAYLEAHQDEFRTPESRMVDVLSLSPQTIAESITITDEEIAAEYEATSDDRIQPERRTVEQIVLEGEEQAARVEEALDAGEPWDELVAALEVEPAIVGTRSQDEFTDPDFAEAAFSLDEGGYALLDGTNGQRVIHVSDIQESQTVPLEDAHDEIADELALAQANEQYLDIFDQVEEARAAFRPLADIGDELDLPVTRVAVTRSGAELAEISDIPAGERPQVVESIYAAEESRLAPAIRFGSDHHVFVELQSVNEPADQSLDEIHEVVAEAWRQEQYDAIIAERVETIETRLAEGASLTDLAIEFNLFTETSQPFTRSGLGGTPIDMQVADAVFAGGPNHTGAATNASGDEVIFEVTSVDAAEEDPGEQIVAGFSEDIRLDVLSSFITGVRDSAGLRINQQALDQALSTTGSL